jgi:hypothetical protein
MGIASVVQGLVELEGGKVFELVSPKGVKWLESVKSFRYEPSGDNKPYTVRQEKKKGGDYWYGYRKVAGKLHKRYIGATSSLSIAKLEEIAEALNVPQERRVTEIVTELVTYKPADDELATLKAQVQALQESLEALRNELLGKPQAGEIIESPELDTEVTDSELLIKLGNLKVENEALRTAQLTAEFVPPEAPDLLNRLKAKRKKATASLADVEAILEILEELTPDGGI